MTTVRNQHEDCISGRKDSKKLIITPHIAWASVEARNRLIQIRTVSGTESTMPKLPTRMPALNSSFFVREEFCLYISSIALLIDMATSMTAPRHDISSPEKSSPPT